ncbi:MAG: PTS sugar transporter subunit IIA [Gemmatimonadota bacterium]|nr:PTS sugar transporter subunit IIA [Gemmatimonadota bacterium]
MKLSEFVEPDLIVTDVEAGDVEDVLRQLLVPLAERGGAQDPDRVLKALLAREKVLSTGIGQGIAVPHAVCDAVVDPSLIVGLSPGGVDFHSMDEAPVHVFFVLLSPPDRAGHHIRLLARIARLSRHPEFVTSLRASAGADEVVARIRDYERDHV